MALDMELRGLRGEGTNRFLWRAAWGGAPGLAIGFKNIGLLNDGAYFRQKRNVINACPP